MEEDSVIKFLKTYGTLIIAVYGVIQIWLVALYKKFRKGKISIYKTGFLELGYSSFGPTIAINGTLRAENKDVFVKEIIINVTKHGDSSNRKFEWTTFRPTQIKVDLTSPFGQQLMFEIPSSFNVLVNQPFRYHIFFSDRETQSLFAPYLHTVIKDWETNNFLKSIDTIFKEARSVTKDIGESAYKDFLSNNKTWKDAYDFMKKEFYWTPGKYSMRMIVKSSSPDKTYEDSPRSFYVDELTSRQLETNVEVVLKDICLKKNESYFFGYLKYE
jgi:hypothetical protein